jgi:hypothetical protein
MPATPRNDPIDLTAIGGFLGAADVTNRSRSIL